MNDLEKIGGPFTCYLAPEGLEAQTKHYLKNVVGQYGRLFITKGEEQFCPFAQNIWRQAKLIPYTSIADAAAKLKAEQRNWSPYSFHLHRRAALIQEKLPFIKKKLLPFPCELPQGPMGSFLLLDEQTMLAAADCSSKFPNGEPQFEQNHIDPPSRAYLKLFEALTIFPRRPKAGETCMELGASPGGWTWVLANLGAGVTAIDRAPLDERLAKNPLIKFVKGDAFTMTPDRIGAIDWLISDVICYPEKLFEFVKLWLDSGKCQNVLVTLKFQGDTNYDAIKLFASIPRGCFAHLAVNKHELTWYYTSEDC